MRRPRILLADDHVLMTEALQHLLQADFDVVGTVSDGRALLKAAGELHPELVVVDIGMPLLNGLDAGEQLKALHPDIKVIYLTQNREPRYAVEAFRRRAAKPDSGIRSQSKVVEQFIETLEAALSKDHPTKSDARAVHRALQAIADERKE